MSKQIAAMALAELPLQGYEVEVLRERPSWRGYPKTRKHTPILARRSEDVLYVTSCKDPDVIDQVILADLPHVARIYARYGTLVLTEFIDGNSLWELDESDRPRITSVKTMLEELLDALQANSLVHGDIRPWNILYNRQREFRLIDWDYGFIQSADRSSIPEGHLKRCGHDPPFGPDVDRTDAERTVAALLEPKSSRQSWRMKRPPTWHPSGWSADDS